MKEAITGETQLSSFIFWVLDLVLVLEGEQTAQL